MPRYKFGDIAYYLNEKRMPTPDDKETYIGLEHLDSGSLRVTRYGSDVEITGQKLIMHKGDILFGRRNTYLRRVAIAPHDGLFSAHGMIWRPKTEVVDERFFPFFIASDYFMNEAIRISVGSLSPTINWRDLKELEFDLPELNLQKQLANLLWAQERTRIAYQELITKTDDLVKSQFIEMFGDPVKNEMQWQTKSLEEACRIIVDCPHSTPNYTNEDTGFMCIRTSIVKKNRIVWDEIEYICEDEYNKRIQRKRPEKGDVVYTREGAILGIAAVIDRDCNVALGQRSMLLSPDTEQCTPEFLSAAMNCDTFLDNALKGQSGSASPHINVGDIKAFKMIMPPVEQQRQFSAFIQQADKSKFAAQQALESLTATQKALMKKHLA